jgi:hypothetical protein
MFVTTFNKLSKATSLARQAAHQDVDSTNDFPSPLGTQRNRYHFFQRRGGLIQVDIGGHPPFPTGSKQFSGNLLFLVVLTFGAILRD